MSNNKMLQSWFVIAHFLIYIFSKNKLNFLCKAFFLSKKPVFGYKSTKLQFILFFYLSLNRVCWHPWTALIELWVALFPLESHSWLELQPGRSKNCHTRQILEKKGDTKFNTVLGRYAALYPITVFVSDTFDTIFWRVTAFFAF